MTPATLERTRTAPALSFEAFTYRYPDGAALALEEVSLEIPAGQFVLVCGDSGSGKSSFLRAVSGLVPHHFGGEAAGTICAATMPATSPRIAARCCRIQRRRS
jgi:energy-coupling factor transport system ATP-binding protein